MGYQTSWGRWQLTNDFCSRREVLTRARSFAAIVEYAHDTGRVLLEVLGVDAGHGGRTIRRILHEVDPGPPHVGASNIAVMTQRLRCAVLLPLADPRAYLDEADARVTVVRELNELLTPEDYQVVYQGSRFQLVTRTGMLARPEMREPVRLTADLAEIVKDEKFGQRLTRRLEEAHLRWGSGPYAVAVIMPGSLLEGVVLYDVARGRHTGGPGPKDPLYGLIGLAGPKGWIAKGMTDYPTCYAIIRNLVHPKRQLVDNYALKDHTVRMASDVVVAAPNDLGVEPGTT